jgi:saccharopine dehydrogenase-like NADP-dependent oxidoreductase
MASRNSALYLKKGKMITVASSDLFKDRFSHEFPGIGVLDVYPNRDSISYIEIYGIPEAQTVYRGTFRFSGWCEALDLMKSINLLDDSIADYSGMTRADFVSERAGLSGMNVKKELCDKTGIHPENAAIRALDWLGMFEQEKLNYGETSPFEIISDLMISKMSLSHNERDMVILQHIFHATYPGKREIIKSSMLDFGSPSTNTAIARTVALPAAIAVTLILNKKINLVGVQRPVVPEIYEPVLEGLEKLGIKLVEERKII